MTMPGGWELVLILAVFMLFFGMSKLPKAARNLGQSLRILKEETEVLREEERDRDALS